MNWKKVTLVGVGLLGGSLGQALKQRRLARRVTGFVRREATVAESIKVGAVDDATLDLASAVEGADLVVFCTPIAQMSGLLSQMRPALSRGAIVTDVGSVKRSVVKELDSLASRAGAYFVGSHPMAGSEQTGVSAARPDLFTDAVCVVTPTAKTHDAALRRVSALWQSIGCKVIKLSPKEHDLLVSRSSHLPHILAAALTSLVLDPRGPKQQAVLCANGFRDTTRIASGSPEMWRDIALTNADNLERALEQFSKSLEAWKSALANRDAETLTRLFTQAKKQRDAWRRGHCSASPE